MYASGLFCLKRPPECCKSASPVYGCSDIQHDAGTGPRPFSPKAIDRSVVNPHLISMSASLYKTMPAHVRKLRESATRQKRLKDRREFQARQRAVTSAVPKTYGY